MSAQVPSKRHLWKNVTSLTNITIPKPNPNICVIQLFFQSLMVLTINYHLLTDHHCQWSANSHPYSWVCLLWIVQLIILVYQNWKNIAWSNQQVGVIWIYNCARQMHSINFQPPFCPTAQRWRDCFNPVTTVLILMRYCTFAPKQQLHLVDTTIQTPAISYIATFSEVACCTIDHVTAIRQGLLHLKYLASSIDLLRASQKVMLFGHPAHNWKPGLATQK